MPLTLRDAEKAVQAAQASAIKMGVNVSICVVDARGDLVAAARMDKARYFTADVARGKAMVSAMFGQLSGAMAERGGSPIMQNLNQMNQGKMFFAQGAVPIAKDGEVVGAVGVSGATSQQDEDVAKASVAAL
jgi:uncharacterized protein GlcG (DUF336 family)